MHSNPLQIRALSSAVLNILQASTPHDAVCLQKFETIICAGLDSSHMSIAKRFVEMWRSSFGLQESLACPMSISRALVKLELYMKNQPPPDSQVRVSLFCLSSILIISTGPGQFSLARQGKLD